MYVMERPTKWEDYLHLTEFAYNNGYQASAKINPFEIMHGRKCTTPVIWDNPMDRLMIGPKMLQDMEQTVWEVHKNLKVVQYFQKSYADLKRQHKEFSIKDHVYL